MDDENVAAGSSTRPMTFPPELWLQILDHAFSPQYTRETWNPFSDKGFTKLSHVDIDIDETSLCECGESQDQQKARFDVQLLRTCRFFQEAGRSYLYGRRRIRTGSSDDALQWAQRIGARNLAEVRHLSVHMTCQMGEEQRQLDAQRWKVFLDGTRVESMTLDYHTSSDADIHVIADLKNLRLLEWDQWVPNSGLWQNGAARNLEALTLRPWFTDTSHFRNCAELFPRLNQLEVFEPGDRDPGLLTRFSPLKKLKIVWVRDVAGVWKAIKTHHAATIKELGLCSLDGVATNIVAAILPNLIQLERLELRLSDCSLAGVLSSLPRGLKYLLWHAADRLADAEETIQQLKALPSTCPSLDTLRFKIKVPRERFQGYDLQEAWDFLQSKGFELINGEEGAKDPNKRKTVSFDVTSTTERLGAVSAGYWG
ncbi:MAG: hypothetical protein M1815_001715 [Lichina confinis]|nr:MAG: hypothetical protein M1815_001715 [Lichina confinis]